MHSVFQILGISSDQTDKNSCPAEVYIAMEGRIDKIKCMYGMIYFTYLSNKKPPKTIVIIISVGVFKIRWYEETSIPNVKVMELYRSYARFDTKKLGVKARWWPLTLSMSYSCCITQYTKLILWVSLDPSWNKPSHWKCRSYEDMSYL